MIKHTNKRILRHLRPNCLFTFKLKFLSTHSKFFNQNLIPSKQFQNSYQQINTIHKPIKDVIDYPHVDAKDFQLIIDDSNSNIPRIGSFVEFQDDCKIKAGVVIQDLQAKFDERFNHLLVLTTDNSILQIKPTNIKFHLYKLIQDDIIDYHSIIVNRHDPAQQDRDMVLSYLKNFINESLIYKNKISPLFNNLHSQFSQRKIAPISILDIVDALKLKESDVMRFGSSLFWQHVFLYSIHWNMIDSTNWLVPNYFEANSVSNLALWQHSNDYHSISQYYVNSEKNQSNIHQFLHNFQNESYIEEVQKFLAKLGEMTKEEMNIYMKVFEGRHFVDVIEVMKFAIIYPHDSILKELSKLNLTTVTDIYKLLVDLKIYDNTTNIYLSSGLFGATRQLNVSDTSQINNNPRSLFNAKDNFKHLRTKKFYHDHVIYGLGEEDESSQFGVSIETVNSRKHIVSVHIPDLISFIPPDSLVFRNIFENSFIKNNTSVQNELFPANLKNKRSFNTYANFHENDEVWENIDAPKKKRRNISEVTCLTISFQFNSFETNSFESFNDKISVSFDSISNVTVKNVNNRILQKCLTGQLEPSFFKLLRMKRDKQEETEDKDVHLNKVDIHNLNYIYHVMKSFFKSREFAGSASVGSKSQADFMIDETKNFANCLAAEFFSQNNVPVVIRLQDLDQNEYSSDEVLVEHDNMLIPAFDSERYSHSIMAKNVNGYISENAKVISNNYLAPATKNLINFERNLPMGFNRGSVDIINVFDSGEALLNQYQLLSYMHYLLSLQMDTIERIQKYNHLKSLGYNLQGPFTQSQLSALIKQDDKIWNYQMNKFKKLRSLQEKPESLQCVVTNIKQRDRNQVLCQAYCFELGIEIDAITKNQDIKVGGKLQVDEIINIDPINGKCTYLETLGTL
ncbi:hypothetical protein KGF54_004024 [Candida jiufengensis]|uniref:uncharacterized protein n=1 Tax=Candida jiufengensis TaxID=497108 RepID=UPI0022246BF8|nr:uncharacterized protein KGF54_004024 [Candida jiufengensis]KAI5950950.1 hypothetical protein KGF54_004024 [Candida jiufengensis]